jgi:hypothetical protein
MWDVNVPLTGNVQNFKILIEPNPEGEYSSKTQEISGVGIILQDNYENIVVGEGRTMINLHDSLPAQNSSQNRKSTLLNQASDKNGVIFVSNNVRLNSGTLTGNQEHIHTGYRKVDFVGDYLTPELDGTVGYIAMTSGGGDPLYVFSGFGVTGNAGSKLQFGDYFSKNVFNNDEPPTVYGHFRTNSDCESWMKTTVIIDSEFCLNPSDDDFETCQYNVMYNCSGDWGEEDCGCGEFKVTNERFIGEGGGYAGGGIELKNGTQPNIDAGNGYMQAWGFLKSGESLAAELSVSKHGMNSFLYGNLLAVDITGGTGSYEPMRGLAQAPLFKVYVNEKEV